MSLIFKIHPEPFTPAVLAEALRPGVQLALSAESREAVQRGHAFLLDKLGPGAQPYYGINTGFGALCNTIIPPGELTVLQRNLLMSHACGSGDTVPEAVVRNMLLFKIHSLAKGHSGVSPETVQRLMDFFNRGVYPVVYTLGSLGASGDLAPLAHLSLPLIGLGDVWLEGERLPATELERRFGWPPLNPGPKEGLALLNGTQFMSAYGWAAVDAARNLCHWADAIAALSLEAFACRTEPFHPSLQDIHPHPGQVRVAERVRMWLRGSPLAAQPKPQVQDPYSFRCVPQVHGAVNDAVDWAERTVLTEINAVSDNPNLFPDEDLILAGGNFHGQSIALALDTLALALSHLGGISERRIFQLQGGLRGLPLFLTPNPGLHSGLMILQYAAAGVLNQLRHAALPVTQDSIPSCLGQEDYVSMGANSAVKSLKSIDYLTSILSIELIHASQGLWLRGGRTSPQLEAVLSAFRQAVPPVGEDRVLAPDIEAARRFLSTEIPSEVYHPQS